MPSFYRVIGYPIDTAGIFMLIRVPERCQSFNCWEGSGNGMGVIFNLFSKRLPLLH